MKENDKKLIIVTHSAGNGGAERVSCILANQFAKFGYDVTFYAIHSDKHDYYLNEKIHYVYFDLVTKNKVFKQIERAIRLKRYIKTHGMNTMISFVCVEGILLCGNKKLRKIYSLRNDPNRIMNKGIMRVLRNMIYKDADSIVFQTEEAQQYFSKDIQEKSAIISNPIRTDLPYWNEDNHSNDIITACRINLQKNIPMLLDAFSIFLKKKQEYRLVIYGKGDLLDEYKQYACDLGIEEHVEFAGFCDTVQEKMKNAAMYVSSSDFEGISNSMLEALAIGVPCVCTDCPVGGAKMFIDNGNSGFLVPVGDSKSMAERMLQVVSDIELQKRFSRNSQTIRARLGEEQIVGEWAKLV